VALPDPVPGLVIRYSYLWHAEHARGREEGQKDRPCAIVAAIRTDADGKTRVLVLPITHSPPEAPEYAVELPASVKARPFRIPCAVHVPSVLSTRACRLLT
jgi:hypothetical protein